MKMAIRNKRRMQNSRLQLLVFPALAILLMAAMFLVIQFVTGETQMKLEEPVYQYFTDQKVQYDAGTKLVPENGNKILFEESGQQNSGDVTPIYYENSQSILLPIDMSWMDPLTNREWRIPAFSRLEMDEDRVVWYRGEDEDIRMESGFLSNGKGTYVFLDDVTILFNGISYEAAPLSFYSAAGGMYRIYQYQSQELTTEEKLTQYVTIWSTKGYQTDLSVGIYTAADGSQRLLVASPSVLAEIEER